MLNACAQAHAFASLTQWKRGILESCFYFSIFFAIATLADSQIKAWLGSDNLSLARRGPWAYIYTPKVNIETSCGMYIHFHNIKPLQK